LQICLLAEVRCKKPQQENKLDLIPVTIIDDFFDDPDYIRSEALKLTFERTYNAPGARAICPSGIADIVCKKIFATLIDMNKHIVEGKADLYFQLTTEEFEEGWVHTDAGQIYFAGVVYLTPNAPLLGGTSIYKAKSDLSTMNSLQQIKSRVYTGDSNNLEEFKKTRKQNNDLFYKTVEVSNVYNRLFIYPANEFHSENKLFGLTKEDARLTLVFFVTHIASNSMFPIDRMKLIEG
jgi:hypothetical protein